MEPAVQNENMRITLLQALIQGFKACEQRVPPVITREDFQSYYSITDNAMRYFYDQHKAIIELQMQYKSLEGENSRAEEQNQKLNNEVWRLKMEILGMAAKLREAEHRDANYILNWVDLAANEKESECSTGTLEAAPEDEKARQE